MVNSCCISPSSYLNKLVLEDGSVIRDWRVKGVLEVFKPTKKPSYGNTKVKRSRSAYDGESYADNLMSVYSYKRGDVHMPLIKLSKLLRFDGFHYFGGVNEKNVNYYSSNLGGGSLIAIDTS